LRQRPDPRDRRFDAWDKGTRWPRSSQWIRRARQLGLREDPKATVFTLQGAIAGISTEIERQPRGGDLRPPPGQEKLDWRWSISMTGLDFEGRLALARESVLSGLAKVVTGQDVLTGDDDFDGLALIRGEPEYALAVLSYNVRRTLTVALSRGVHFGPDSLAWQFWDRTLPRRVLSRARQLAVLADRLVLDDEHVRRGLLRNAVRDPLTSVRRHNLALLTGRGDVPPDAPALQAALAAAASDDAALVRTASTLLTRAVRFDPRQLDVLPEPALVCLLQHGPGEGRIDVIERLAETGNSWSLGALGEASRGLLSGRRVRAAAREAVQRIIARHGDLKEGGLSLAPVATGDLSLIPGAEAGLEFAE
jgi:hypothetical protein